MLGYRYLDNINTFKSELNLLHYYKTLAIKSDTSFTVSTGHLG